MGGRVSGLCDTVGKGGVFGLLGTNCSILCYLATNVASTAIDYDYDHKLIAVGY